MKIVDVQETPNPDALKFVVEKDLLGNGVRQFDNREAAQNDPLAKSLFDIAGITSAFYMGQFVTVTKVADMPWERILPALRTAIQNQADKVLTLKPATNGTSRPQADNATLLNDINRVLDENVRPALAGDGGGLEVLGLDGYVLTIHYQGACGGCPSASAGTMAAVENLLQRMVDPRLRVVAD